MIGIIIMRIKKLRNILGIKKYLSCKLLSTLHSERTPNVKSQAGECHTGAGLELKEEKERPSNHSLLAGNITETCWYCTGRPIMHLGLFTKVGIAGLSW